MEECKRLLDNICCIKESIAVLEEELLREKMLLLDEMSNIGIDDINGKFGKASLLSYTRGTLNTDKTEDVILTLKRDSGVPVSLDDCKRFTDCRYVLVKRKKDTIIPTWEEYRGV